MIYELYSSYELTTLVWDWFVDDWTFLQFNTWVICLLIMCIVLWWLSTGITHWVSIFTILTSSCCWICWVLFPSTSSRKVHQKHHSVWFSSLGHILASVWSTETKYLHFYIKTGVLMFTHLEHVLPVLVSSWLARNILEERFTLPVHVFTLPALLVPLQLSSTEVLQLALLSHLARDLAQDPLHHGQVLVAGVRVKHHGTDGQLEDDAAHAPDIAALVPA